MEVKPNAMVMWPCFTPFPRYGRMVKMLDESRVLVTQVSCGDPRCTAEHRHIDAAWPVAEVEDAAAYQGRGSWEEGRKITQNALVDPSPEPDSRQEWTPLT